MSRPCLDQAATLRAIFAPGMRRFVAAFVSAMLRPVEPIELERWADDGGAL